MAKPEVIREEIRIRIAASASSVMSRFEREGMDITYARDIDQLYVHVGSPTATLAFPLEDKMDAVLLYDPETYEIRGWEFPSFLNRYEHARGTNASLDFFAHLIEHNDTVYIPGDIDKVKAEKAVFELALVV